MYERAEISWLLSDSRSSLLVAVHVPCSPSAVENSFFNKQHYQYNVTKHL